jgi:3-oxoacyl-[acyl-carrier protein] reductase
VGDLSNEATVEQLASQIASLDILVNNAGMTSISSPADTDEATDIPHMTHCMWRRGLARNLDTAFLVTKSLLLLLRNSPSGRIIMVSSVTGPVMAMQVRNPSTVTAFLSTCVL